MLLDRPKTSPQQIEEVFHQVCALHGAAREAALSHACGTDQALRLAVEQLLAAGERADGRAFWNDPAIVNEAKSIALEEDSTALDRYRLIERIGTGGMGVVYRAVRADDTYAKQVAIKIVQHTAGGNLVERFSQERQILAGLEHPHIARLLDGGTTPAGQPFLVMEYVDGVPIDRFIQINKPSRAAILQMFQKICSAVAYAHRNLIVHRDLKPGNILVTPEGEPKLLDFGIAKLLSPGKSAAANTLGGLPLTPGYASPEQVRGQAITTASDVYSLGVVLYEILTGVSPYGASATSVLDMMQTVCEKEPEKPSSAAERRSKEGAAPPEGVPVEPRDLAGDLDTIVLKALRKEPSERYSSVEQFSEDLDRYARDLPVLARRETFSYVAAKFIRRNKLALGAAALLVLTLAGGIVATMRAQARAERRFEDIRQLAHSVVFDYHDAIEPLPGSTPVRQMLVKDALVYLDKLSREADDLGLQRELVEAYVKIANVQGNSYYSNLGDSSAAIASAKKAIDLGEELVRRQRNGPNLRALASAYAAQAELLHGANSLTPAGENYRRAIALSEEAVKDSLRDSDARRLLIATTRHYGDLLGGEGSANLGKTEEASAAYRRSLDLARAWLKDDPQSKIAIKESYDSYMAIAAVDRTAGRRAASEEESRNALAIIQKISATDPLNTTNRVEVAGALARLVVALMDNAKPHEAVPFALEAVSIMERQLAADPSNALYRRNLSVTEIHVANAMRKAGDPRGALSHVQKSLVLAEQVSASNPKDSESASDVANSHFKMGEVLADLGQGPAALQQDIQAIDILKRMLAGSTDSNLLRLLIRSHLAAADAEVKMNHESSGMEHYDEAARIAQGIVQNDPRQAYARSELARALTGIADGKTRLGNWREARDHYRGALENWTELRRQNALGPDELGLPEQAAFKVAWCESKLKP